MVIKCFMGVGNRFRNYLNWKLLMINNNKYFRSIVMKKVAIVLVNYNGFSDTMDCVNSIKKSNYKNYFIIVVDNCSTDSSFEVLKKQQEYQEFVLLKSEYNEGFSAGNNIGIEYALNEGAEYILLLNNDTIVEADFIEHLLEGFSFSQTCGATIGKIMCYPNKDIIWYAGGSLSKTTARTVHFRYGEEKNLLEEKISTVSFATGCCLCISREVIEKIGLLDEDFFLYEEDAEYSFRIQKYGYDIVYTPKSIIYHKVSASTGDGSSLTQYYAVRNKYILIKKCYKGINKILAYAYSTLFFIYRCVRRKISFKYFMKGIKGFLRNEIKKTSCRQI